MILEEFIEFLGGFPQDYVIDFHLLDDKLDWAKQEFLDVGLTAKEQTVNFYMYSDDKLKLHNKK